MEWKYRTRATSVVQISSNTTRPPGITVLTLIPRGHGVGRCCAALAGVNSAGLQPAIQQIRESALQQLVTLP